MLKHKIKSLEKEIKQISNKKMNGVYFVELMDEIYVINAPGRKTIFQGSHEEYKNFISKHGKSVFIVDDIPRLPREPTLSDWAN